MAAVLEPEVDLTAVSLARAVAIANRRAREMGYLPEKHRLAVEQDESATGMVWRVNYVPDVGVNQRGGGCIIDVNSADGTIQKELRCQ